MPDTIAAIATAPVRSAIGIIRMSGGAAIKIADVVFKPKNGSKFYESEDRRLIYGTLFDEIGGRSDICLATKSKAPLSYTGEDTVEFHCHGSPTLLREALRTLFKLGARQALPGEFTKRAFLNGRMDLIQAEAVIDLIDAETAEAAKNAAGQLGGAITKKTDIIYNELVQMAAHYHAVIDYPDEDIDPFDLSEKLNVLERASSELNRLERSFDYGRVLKEGIKSAIVGKPNAGKSSLLNAILGYDRAIVTEIPGTTRDTIEEKIKLGGVVLRLSDTAGIRKTEDPIEKIGVDRAKSAAFGAELIIAVFDGSDDFSAEDEETVILAKKAGRGIAVVNKSDLGCKINITKLRGYFDGVCHVSALNGEGLDTLDGMIREMFASVESPYSGEIITNARQAEAVARALASVDSAISAIKLGIPPDIVLTEIEAAMQALGELSGKTIREDITARIFEQFCVGK